MSAEVKPSTSEVNAGGPARTFGERLRMTGRIVRVRARFLIVIVVAFVVVGQWDTLGNYWDRLTRPAGGLPTGLQAVSNDTEYFCPMDPGVVSDWPAKCGICNMALVRRKRGEMAPLPSGVIARVQMTPYRLQLGGIQTSRVTTQRLERTIESIGQVRSDSRRSVRVQSPRAGLVREVLVRQACAFVRSNEPLLRIEAPGEGTAAADDLVVRAPSSGCVVAMRVREGDGVAEGATLCELADLDSVVIEAEVYATDAPLVDRGQAVAVSSETSGAEEPAHGTIRSVRALGEDNGGKVAFEAEVANPHRTLWPGRPIVARVQVPIASVEPFLSLPRHLPALREGDPRKVFICMNHADVIRTEPGACPNDKAELLEQALADNERVQWWCPMHPNVRANRAGGRCDACGGMVLVPRVIAYLPPDEVLAVPETAVIDTGTKTFVYLERMPGMFEGVEVVLGPRCGGSYPVLKGLEVGQRVVTSGAILVDAETHLNPSIASSYFGAGTANAQRGTSSASGASSSPALSANPASAATADTGDSASDEKLSPADQALVSAQKTCPVTGKRLGSMGTPVRLVVGERVVFVCCSGCETPLREHPDKYLKKSTERSK